jgi:cyclic pyranopterin phosphate synthase
MESRIGMNMDKEIQGIVEIGEKPVVERKATATGLLHLQEATKQAIVNKTVKKGDVLEASTIAAIQAVKETPRIIPHCHPIPLEGCKVDWAWEETSLRCTVHVSAHYKTGIEMEAMTGVSAGLLCVLDMIKSYEKDEQGQYPHASISDVHIVEKRKG